MKFEIDGEEELLEWLDGLEEDFNQSCTKHLNQLGNEWVAETQNLTPYDTGNLKHGWRFEGVEKSGKDFNITVYNNTEYAAAIEFGHRQEPGRYVPAIGKRLVRDFVPGHHMLDKSTNKARKGVKLAMDRVIEDLEQ